MVKYKTYDPASGYDFLYEFEVICFDEDGKEIYTYYIQADCEEDALDCANDFCHDDYPFKRIGEVIIANKEKIEYVQNR